MQSRWEGRAADPLSAAGERTGVVSRLSGHMGHAGYLCTDGETFATATNLAFALGISVKTVAQWVAAGQLPAPRRLPGRVNGWPLSQAVAALERLGHYIPEDWAAQVGAGPVGIRVEGGGLPAMNGPRMSYDAARDMLRGLGGCQGAEAALDAAEAAGELIELVLRPSGVGVTSAGSARVEA